METLMSFSEKVVIVTGASSGIGAESAKMFSEYGAKVTLVGRNEERLTSVALQCQAKSGFPPVCLLLDLTVNGNCEAVVEKTIQTYGRIDVLLNCAGSAAMTSIFDQNIDEFDEMMAINLRVPVRLSQLVVPHLVKTKGNIVNMSFSMMNKFVSGTMGYNMSKIALERFAKQAAPELVTEGVRINTVCAGFTKTDIVNCFFMDEINKDLIFDEISHALPCGKIMEPREVAINICMVASDLFPHLNGANFVVDGGASLA